MKKKKIQITNSRNEEVSIGPLHIKRIIRKYLNNFESSLVAQQVKDPALRHLWHKSQRQRRIHPWPGSFHMLQVWPKKKKIKIQDKCVSCHHALVQNSPLLPSPTVKLIFLNLAQWYPRKPWLSPPKRCNHSCLCIICVSSTSLLHSQYCIAMIYL